MILICVVLTLAFLLFLMPDRLNAEPVIRPQVDQGHVAGLEENLASVIALSEEELVRLIPNRSGFRFVDCPNCAGGAEENQLSWSIEEPHRVFCQFCNMRFPNELYPENGVTAGGQSAWRGPGVSVLGGAVPAAGAVAGTAFSY